MGADTETDAMLVVNRPVGALAGERAGCTTLTGLRWTVDFGGRRSTAGGFRSVARSCATAWGSYFCFGRGLPAAALDEDATLALPAAARFTAGAGAAAGAAGGGGGGGGGG